MQFFSTSDGVRICYDDNEQREPSLLFVHGWCSNLNDWQPQADSFSLRYRVIRYDRRGHGRSQAPATGYSPAQHAQDLAELVAHLNVRGLVLVAHAGGAPTALAFAAAHPDAVRGLALIEANLYAPQDQFERTQSLMQALREPDSNHVFMQAYRRFLSPDGDPVLAARVVENAAATPRRVILAELEGLVVDTESRGGAHPTPRRWISAVPRAGRTDGAGVAQVFGNVRYGQVVGAAHFPQLEVPAQVNAMLAEFLRMIPAPVA